MSKTHAHSENSIKNQEQYVEITLFIPPLKVEKHQQPHQKQHMGVLDDSMVFDPVLGDSVMAI